MISMPPKTCVVKKTVLGRAQVCTQPIKHGCTVKTITPVNGRYAGKSVKIVQCPPKKHMFEFNGAGKYKK